MLVHRSGKNMQKNKNYLEDCIAEPYEDKVRGLNLTPDEDKELRELYNRSVLPGRPVLLCTVGLMLIDAFCVLHAVSAVAKKEYSTFMWFTVFMLTQMAGAGLLAYRMGQAEKQLNNRIKEIKTKIK